MRLLLLVLSTFLFSFGASAGGRCSFLYEQIRGTLFSSHAGNPVALFLNKLDSNNFPHLRPNGYVYEAGVIEAGKNTFLNDIIKEVTASGGQVRSLRLFLSFSLIPQPGWSSHFRVSARGEPILAIELGSEKGTILHELAHFRDWRFMRDKLIRDGTAPDLAGRKAYQALLSSPSMTRWTEQNAVAAELSVSPTSSLWHPNHIGLITYPEREAIDRRLMKRKELTSRDLAELNSLMEQIAEKALIARELRVIALREDISRTRVPWRKVSLRRQLQRESDLSTLWAEIYQKSDFEKFVEKLSLKGKTPKNAPPSFETWFAERLEKVRKRREANASAAPMGNATGRESASDQALPTE